MLFHREISLYHEFPTKCKGKYGPAEVSTAAPCWWKRILLHILAPHVWSYCGLFEYASTNNWSHEENNGKICMKLVEFIVCFTRQIDNRGWRRLTWVDASLPSVTKTALRLIEKYFAGLSHCFYTFNIVVKCWLQNNINTLYIECKLHSFSAYHGVAKISSHPHCDEWISLPSFL